MGTDQLNRLTELEFYAYDLSTVDEFADTYQRLLNECKVSKDMATAQAMQQILMRQVEFLMNQWIKEKQTMPSMALTEYGKNN